MLNRHEEKANGDTRRHMTRRMVANSPLYAGDYILRLERERDELLQAVLVAKDTCIAESGFEFALEQIQAALARLEGDKP